MCSVISTVDGITCNSFTTWNSKVVLTHITRQFSCLAEYIFYCLPPLIEYPSNTGINLLIYLAKIPVYPNTIEYNNHSFSEGLVRSYILGNKLKHFPMKAA